LKTGPRLRWVRRSWTRWRSASATILRGRCATPGSRSTRSWRRRLVARERGGSSQLRPSGLPRIGAGENSPAPSVIALRDRASPHPGTHPGCVVPDVPPGDVAWDSPHSGITSAPNIGSARWFGTKDDPGPTGRRRRGRRSPVLSAQTAHCPARVPASGWRFLRPGASGTTRPRCGPIRRMPSTSTGPAARSRYSLPNRSRRDRTEARGPVPTPGTAMGR
jgi:hypothetical protein